MVAVTALGAVEVVVQEKQQIKFIKHYNEY